MNKAVQLLIVGFAIVLSSCSNDTTNKTPETEMQKVSYIIASNMAKQLKSQGLDTINANAVAKAFKDVLEGNDLDISEEESMKILQDFFGKRQEAEEKKEAEERIAALSPEEREKIAADVKSATTYLTENAAKEGIVTTESGLQYEVMTTGNGAKPTAKDQVTVHYHGMLTDGTVFDSSVERGEHAQFGVTQVIPGWVEALQLMSVGDKWKLTIPSSLAYGDKGAGGLIGPGETLVFEVELIRIN